MLLVIGLALGTIGGAMRVLTVVFADRIVEAVQASPQLFEGSMARAKGGLRVATDRSPGHLLAIAGNLALVLAGGALGLAGSLTASSVGRIAMAGAAIAAGIGLLVMRSWVAAGAYLIGGFLLLVVMPPGTDQSPPPGAEGPPAP